MADNIHQYAIKDIVGLTC